MIRQWPKVITPYRSVTDNRSSLQFISAKGKPLTQKENDEMVKALEAAFSKSSVK